MKNTAGLRVALLIGMIGALGSMATDMYLPVAKQIASDLKASEGLMHMCMMTFMLGLALGQLGFGALSDRIGRRKTILTGIAIYAVASFACVFVNNIYGLIFCRLVQGMGAAVGMSVGMAVVRDLYTGIGAVKLMSMIAVVIGATPVVAPIFGSMIAHYGGWHMIFLVLGIAAVLVFITIALFLPETTTEAQRRQFQLPALLAKYGTLLLSRDYIPYVVVAFFCHASFLAYVSGSTFFFTKLHGMSSMGYSLLFAFNSLGIVVAAVYNARLNARFGSVKVVRTAVTVLAICCWLLLTLRLLRVEPLLPYCVLLFAGISMMPFIMPTSRMMALTAWGAIAGTAAALMATLMSFAGATSIAAVASFADGSSVSMFAVMAACTACALFCAFAFLPRHFDIHGKQAPSLQAVQTA